MPDIDLKGRKLSTSEMWETTAHCRAFLTLLRRLSRLRSGLRSFCGRCFLDSDLCQQERQDGEEAELSVPLYVLLPDPTMAVERVLGEILGEERINSPFFRLWPQLEQTICLLHQALTRAWKPAGSL